MFKLVKVWIGQELSEYITGTCNIQSILQTKILYKSSDKQKHFSHL